MKKINYSFVAQTPVFTGSDENNGTTRSLRREKRLLPERVTIQSQFKDRKSRQTAALNILYSVYKCIDNALKTGNYGYYDAFANKIKTATQCPNKYVFLNQLCESCGVVTITDRYADTVMQMIELFDDSELLEVVRNEHQFLMLRLREAVSRKDEYEMTINDLTGSSTFSLFTKSFEKIPYIGGNSIRGLMRRLLMYDFCVQLGITSLEKETYHKLFTGGTLSDSTGVEDIAMRRGIAALCPPIALLGSAVGNQTIEGALKLQAAGFEAHGNIFYNAAEQLTYYKDEAVCDAPYLHELLEALPLREKGDDNFILGFSDEPNERYFCNFGFQKVFRSNNPADALGEAILYTLKK